MTDHELLDTFFDRLPLGTDFQHDFERRWGVDLEKLKEDAEDAENLREFVEAAFGSEALIDAAMFGATALDKDMMKRLKAVFLSD